MEKTNRGERAALDWKMPLLRGVIGIPVLLLLLLALAFAFERGAIGQGREVLLSRTALLLASMASALYSARCAMGKKLLSGMLGEGALFLFLLVLGVFTRDSSLFNISLVIAILILISGGFLGSILSAGRRKNKKLIKKHNR